MLFHFYYICDSIIKKIEMEILVCISKTPDTTAKIGFVENDSKYDEAGVQFIMNPFDEFYALVRGIELKEALGGNVTVLNVGPAANDVVIRKALELALIKLSGSMQNQYLRLLQQNK